MTDNNGTSTSTTKDDLSGGAKEKTALSTLDRSSYGLTVAAMTAIVKKIVNSVWIDKYYENYPQLSKSSYRKSLKKMFQSLKTQLELSCQSEITILLNEYELKAKLDALDDIIESTEDQDQKAWRPSGNPTQDARPYLNEAKRDSLAKLMEFSAKTTQKEKALTEKTLQLRKDIELLRAQIEKDYFAVEKEYQEGDEVNEDEMKEINYDS